MLDNFSWTWRALLTRAPRRMGKVLIMVGFMRAGALSLNTVDEVGHQPAATEVGRRGDEATRHHRRSRRLWIE